MSEILRVRLEDISQAQFHYVFSEVVTEAGRREFADRPQNDASESDSTRDQRVTEAPGPDLVKPDPESQFYKRLVLLTEKELHHVLSEVTRIASCRVWRELPPHIRNSSSGADSAAVRTAYDQDVTFIPGYPTRRELREQAERLSGSSVFRYNLKHCVWGPRMPLPKDFTLPPEFPSSFREATQEVMQVETNSAGTWFRMSAWCEFGRRPPMNAEDRENTCAIAFRLSDPEGSDWSNLSKDDKAKQWTHRVLVKYGFGHVGDYVTLKHPRANLLKASKRQDAFLPARMLDAIRTHIEDNKLTSSRLTLTHVLARNLMYVHPKKDGVECSAIFLASSD